MHSLAGGRGASEDARPKFPLRTPPVNRSSEIAAARAAIEARLADKSLAPARRVRWLTVLAKIERAEMSRRITNRVAELRAEKASGASSPAPNDPTSKP